ncbi:hypothetical protein ACB092_04G015700 [Castanea dentata]
MERKIHILVIPYPLQGHINLMLQFAKRLASKGPRVTFIATSRISKSIQAHESTSINFETISDGSEEVQDLETIDEKVKRFKSKVSQNLPKLIERFISSKYTPKFLIYDSIIPWALNSCVVNAIYYHAHQRTLQMPLGEGSSISLPSIPSLGINDMPSIFRDIESYPGSDWLLCNTFNELEYEVINWMTTWWPFKTIGPAIPSIYLDKRLEDDKEYGLNLFKPDMDSCMKWLDTKKIVSKGLVVSWCPQLEVLAHKAIGCFMNHCGWNSTLEALSLGVPMIAMPQWMDQTTNAKYIMDVWKVGVRIKVDEKGIITKEEIELCIREVIGGDRGKEMKRNLMKCMELAKEAVDKDGSSDKNIEEFVAKISHL